MGCWHLPRIYPLLNLTPTSSLIDADLMLSAFFSAGIKVVQLRAKNISDQDFLFWAKHCQKQCLENAAELFINDRPDIATIVNAAGVHLGQTDLAPKQIRANFGPQLRIGFSCHSLQQIENACRDQENIDYLALGPIYETHTKSNADPKVGLNQLQKVRSYLDESNIKLPLVAIGGIELTSIKTVLDYGADCIAMVSALGNPDTASKNAREAMRYAS